MSFDVTTLALAKSYVDQHGGGGGPAGDITAEDVSYPNSLGEGAPENVGQALDVLLTGFNATRKDVLRLNESEHTHSNKPVLDKLSDSNGKLQYNGSDVGLKGDKGADGKTPVKGTDYWTAADKQEIINDVIAALPDGTEVSY